MRIGLVGCVKGKATSARPARDLYTSTLFTGRRRYVERSCDRWFILSARHRLIEPDAVTEPYDEALQDVSRPQRREWARVVLGQLAAGLGAMEAHTFEIHAGSAYTDFGLTSGITNLGANVESPAGGLPIGKLLAFYSRQSATGMSDTPAAVEQGSVAHSSSDEPLRGYWQASPRRSR